MCCSSGKHVVTMSSTIQTFFRCHKFRGRCTAIEFPLKKKTLHVRSRCGFRQEPHLDRTSRPKKNHRGDLAGGVIIIQPLTPAPAPSTGADRCTAIEFPLKKRRYTCGPGADFARNRTSNRMVWTGPAGEKYFYPTCELVPAGGGRKR